MSKFSIVTEKFLSDEDNKNFIYANAKVGNLVPIPMTVALNEYFIITGLEYKDNSIVATDKEVIDEEIKDSKDETDEEYFGRLTLDFDRLANETSNAIVVSNESLKILVAKSKIKKDVTIGVKEDVVGL